MGYEKLIYTVGYNIAMIITKSNPFTKEEITKLCEEYEVFIKTVIDMEKRVCSAGATMHFESEEILLRDGSKQTALWGGGIDLETKTITYNSFINIRPAQNNTSNEIQDIQLREDFKELSQYFFKELYE